MLPSHRLPRCSKRPVTLLSIQALSGFAIHHSAIVMIPLLTGCHVVLLQGGLINFSSFVPNPIAASSCESETTTMTVAVMASRQSVMIYCDLLYGNQERLFTVPMFTNSSSGIAATHNQRVTSMSRHIARHCHIARHWYYVRQACQAGHIQLLHIDGDKYQLADLGTKNVPAAEASYKLSIIETSIIEEGSVVAKACEAPTAVFLDLSPMAQSKRGVGNPSGVPGKSHVCSNVDEMVPRSATVSFALDLLSDGVSSVQFTPSSTISPQVESCSLG